MLWLKKLDEQFEECIAVFLFTLMVIVIFLQVLFRFVLNFALDWTEEMARYSFIMLVYISASIAVKRNRHLRTEAIKHYLPSTLSKLYGVLSDTIWLLFTLFMIKTGFTMAMTILATGQKSPVLHLTMGYLYMIVPVGFFLMSVRILQQLIRKLKNRPEPAESLEN